MVKNKESILSIIVGMMIFCIIYIVSVFLTKMVALFPVPLLWCAAIFVAAYLVTLCCRGRLLLVLFLCHSALLVFSVWFFAGQAAGLFMAETPPEVLRFWNTREITFLLTPYILGTDAVMFWLGGVLWYSFKIVPSVIADIFDTGIIV
ncbi:MAG TPA: hypothetical protein GX697_02930, partial [Firmicutes bacterium]|nr:hypothetical protein [Bacillota bacterium]